MRAFNFIISDIVYFLFFRAICYSYDDVATYRFIEVLNANTSVITPFYCCYLNDDIVINLYKKIGCLSVGRYIKPHKKYLHPKIRCHRKKNTSHQAHTFFIGITNFHIIFDFTFPFIFLISLM